LFNLIRVQVQSIITTEALLPDTRNGVKNSDNSSNMIYTKLFLSFIASATLLCTGFVNPESDKTVKIGDQVWMANNLDVSKFRNGDPIPEVKTAEECLKAGAAGKPAWCYYNNDPDNGKKYGKLYNWYAVNDPRGLAPKGWHVPEIKDWKKLINYLGGENVAGTKMKSTDNWDKDGNGTNSSGFAGLPGGRVNCFGTFSGYTTEGNWWSATETIYSKGDKPIHHANSFILDYSYGGIETSSDCKESAYSVRCIKD
jgi:uncharacterized protein (TIGR02145 family)